MKYKYFKKTLAVLISTTIVANIIFMALTFPASANVPAFNWYYIRNVNSGMYLTTESNNTSAIVTQRPFSGSSNQLWYVSKLSNGLHHLAPVSNASSQLILCAGDANGTLVQTAPAFHNPVHQEWHIIQNNNGTHRIVPLLSTTRVLRPQNSSTASGAIAEIWNWTGTNGTTSQQWVFEKGRLLNTPLIGQEMSNWCWAAAALMAARTGGTSNRTQNQIVNHVKGTTGTAPNLGATPSETVVAANFASGTSNYAWEAETYTATILRVYLNMGRPFIIARGTYNSAGVRTGGHVTVIHGYRESGNNFFIQDPLPVGSGTSLTMTHSQIMNSGSSPRWDQTIYRLS